MAAVEGFTQVFRTPDTASPATRRRRPLTIISQNTPMANLTLNDDAAEKRQRRLSRVTSVALSSPCTPRSQSRLDNERLEKLLTVSSLLLVVFYFIIIYFMQKRNKKWTLKFTAERFVFKLYKAFY